MTDLYFNLGIRRMNTALKPTRIFLISLFLSFLFATSVFAVPVNFNPGTFTGYYHNTQTWVKGSTTVDLTASQSHNLLFPWSGENTRFHIDASGQVTTDSSRLFVTGTNTVNINTGALKTVNFDPGSFTGSYHNSKSWVTGPSTIELFSAGTGSDDFGTGRHGLSFPWSGENTRFHIDASGQVTTDSSRLFVTGTNTVTIDVNSIVPVQIDPGSFTGYYHNTEDWVTGPSTVERFSAGTGSDDFGTGRHSIQTSEGLGRFNISAACVISPNPLNIGTASFNLSCSSNEQPVANAGPDQIVEQEGPNGSNVTLNGSGSSDPDGDALTYSWSGPFGSASGDAPTVLVPAGTHSVSLTVNDGTVDSAPDTANVTVQDTTPPSITNNCLADTLSPPNHKMVQAAVGSVSDTVDPDPVISINVTSNQPINGPGDGNTDSDWEIVNNGDGSYIVSLRAERAGNLGQRDYLISVTATDSSGNSSTEECSVVVPHDQRGKRGK